MHNVLLGVVCLDIYTRTNLIRPGCGLLHNAFHLQQLGCQPRLITRIGELHQEIFLDFFQRHQIAILPENIVVPGESASIKIDIEESGEARIFDFSSGVWSHFRLQPPEEHLLSQATNLHLVLVAEIIPEFLRLSQAGLLKNCTVSADFLHFRQFTLEDFAYLLNYVNIAFIGWKGDVTDPKLMAVREIAQKHAALVVITLGERGIQVFDARQSDNFQSHFFAVEKVAVQGNTNGCGDAFIAYFLAEYWPSRNLEKAIEQGKIGGAKATQWNFALPDEVY
jgi:sugar/nucleoside kinase (ribokinase family)